MQPGNISTRDLQTNVLCEHFVWQLDVFYWQSEKLGKKFEKVFFENGNTQWTQKIYQGKGHWTCWPRTLRHLLRKRLCIPARRRIHCQWATVKSPVQDPFAYKTTPLFSAIKSGQSNFSHFQEIYIHIQILGFSKSKPKKFLFENKYWILSCNTKKIFFCSKSYEYMYSSGKPFNNFLI